ncbi:hypothetical protein CR513_07036, partial [Mucuna pruriens]
MFISVIEIKVLLVANLANLNNKNISLATYLYIVLPFNASTLWLMLENEPINPVHVRRALRRHKKQMNMTND